MAAIAVALYKDIYIYIHRYGWFPKNWGLYTPKWMGFLFFFMENPVKNGRFGGYTYFWKHPNRDVDMSDM